MFKKSFKYYKSRKPPPNLTQVLDFLKSEDLLCDNKIKKVPLRMTNLDPFFGLKPLDTWEVYEIVAMPGLLFVKNPFTNLGQRYWTVRCLRDYTKRPNKSNLDPFNKPEDTKNWWDICQNGNKLLLDKMRWVTLGYHHNWDTKVYTENNRGQFPTDLKHMTEFLAKVLGFEQFSAQAAIVNFYHLNSTLSGHTDHSERNLNAPLFSLSFGQKAIFLIGGQQLEDQAIPLFLHSGDILVMSKDSRLNYHGVPKILQGDVSEWSSPESESVPNEYDDVVKVCKDNSAWKPFGDYLKHSRINVNVRQVLFDGEIQLSEEINVF
ncbi:hypothetical protein ABEB36_007530 [Hypothenemus hampei]|uniref:Fe2OG dioxygenase domain-containing protein n=1 Tax=Hypothenemus hampei TaxID=57062 RepID=A0ABD1EUC1_HYPHA